MLVVNNIYNLGQQTVFIVNPYYFGKSWRMLSHEDSVNTYDQGTLGPVDKPFQINIITRDGSYSSVNLYDDAKYHMIVQGNIQQNSSSFTVDGSRDFDIVLGTDGKVEFYCVHGYNFTKNTDSYHVNLSPTTR